MMLDNEKLIDKLVKGMRDGAIELPADVTNKLAEAYNIETEDLSNMQMKAILYNVKLAHDEGLPLCQDTGIQIF